MSTQLERLVQSCETQFNAVELVTSVVGNCQDNDRGIEVKSDLTNISVQRAFGKHLAIKEALLGCLSLVIDNSIFERKVEI